MSAAVWKQAELKAEQECLLKEAEASLGGGVLVPFERMVRTPVELTPSQLECLQGLEQKLGLVLVLVEPA